MEPEYRAILDRRHDQLQEQVKWSSDVAKGLIHLDILSKDELKKIEVL